MIDPQVQSGLDLIFRMSQSNRPETEGELFCVANILAAEVLRLHEDNDQLRSELTEVGERVQGMTERLEDV
jgi:hypothetical protein